MRKLNNKGFTLIELLAVIVILAVILTVASPRIFSAISGARKSTLQNGANIVAEYVETQYGLAQLGQAEDAFLGVCPDVAPAASVYDYVDNTVKSGTTTGMGGKNCANTYNARNAVTNKADAAIGNNNGYVYNYFNTAISNYAKASDATQKANAEKLIAFLEAAGVKPENYGFVRIKITNGRACVALAASDSGAYKEFTPKGKKVDTIGTNDYYDYSWNHVKSNVVRSSGCASSSLVGN